MEHLEMTLLVKPPKLLEFKQTLYDLIKKLQKHCTKLVITESENDLSFSTLFQWNNSATMHEALKNKEFEILSGAITALCEKIEIRLNDTIIGNHISMLESIKKPKYSKS